MTRLEGYMSEALAMTGYVRVLQIQPERKLPFQRVHAARLIAQSGMEGDCHATQSERQVALLGIKVEQWMALQEVKGLCFPRFQANIVMDGIDLSRLNDGDILKIGEAILKIRRYPKICFEECARVQGKLSCILKEDVFYATVLQTGYIRDEDTIYCFAQHLSNSTNSRCDS